MTKPALSLTARPRSADDFGVPAAMGEGGNGKRFKSTSTGREHFAAVAAALGIPSDLVMAAHDVKGKPYAIVLYTPGFPDDDRIWSAHIERGPTGTVTVLEDGDRSDVA